jgi:hypothetical protein
MRFTLTPLAILSIAVQPFPLLAQPIINSGVYGVGSRYILVANIGNRVCYQGVLGIPGRYAIAVGETTGSLSYQNRKFIIDGWKNQYGKTIRISQSPKGLVVTFEDGEKAGYSAEYEYYEPFRNNRFSPVYTKLMNDCLNSSGEYFQTNPGYTINAPMISSNTSNRNSLSRQSGSNGEFFIRSPKPTNNNLQVNTPNPNTCQDAINRSRSKLEMVNSRVGSSNIRNHSYTSYPEGRSLEYVIGIRGSGSADVLNSPVFLRSIADDIISQCKDIGLFSVGLDRSSIGRSYGIMYDGSVKQFRCVGDVYPGRSSRILKLDWGDTVC